MYKKLKVIVVCMLIVFTLSACQSREEQIQECYSRAKTDISSQNYKDAYTISVSLNHDYQENQKSQEIIDSIKSDIDKSINDLLKQNKFDDAEEKIEKLQNTMPNLNDFINDKWLDIQSIKESPRAYNYGLDYFQKKNYKKAYLEFKKVNKYFGKEYQDSQKKMKYMTEVCSKKFIDDAQNEYNKGNYQQAVDLLKDAKVLDESLDESLYISSRLSIYEDTLDKTIRKSQGVSIGMTTQQVLESSWGEPEGINKTTTKYGTSEQWVYGDNYLYFEDGILTSIQN